jgi:hypothetical protein
LAISRIANWASTVLQGAQNELLYSSKKTEEFCSKRDWSILETVSHSAGRIIVYEIALQTYIVILCLPGWNLAKCFWAASLLWQDLLLQKQYVLHKCRLPSQSWATLLCRNASGQNSACQCFLAIRAKATVIVLLLWAEHGCSCQGPLAFSTERTAVALQNKIAASVRARAIRLAGRSEPIWFSITETGSVCFWPNKLQKAMLVPSGSGFIPGASRKLC